MKQPVSLIRRQWLASALCLPLLVGFSAYTLNRAFVSSLDSAENDAMLAQVYSLIALAEPAQALLQLPSFLPNPKLETPDSGLYARVLNNDGSLIWRSNSLESSALALPQSPGGPPGVPQFNALKAVTKENFRTVSFATIWEIKGQDRIFVFEVFHSQAQKQREITRYQRSLLTWLIGMALLLILIQSIVAKWGLKPLKTLAKEIEHIEHGTQVELKNHYPTEIHPVAQSLSKLLNSESDQRTRYKNALSDLAHSLKTPLAAVRSQLGENSKDQIIDEQINRMADIVHHQLKRASAEVKSIYGPETPVSPIVERLCSSLAKVYRDKRVDFHIDIDPNLRLKMHENDLMEVLGNLLDNACKYGDAKVSVTGHETDSTFYINIEDNGGGIPHIAREEILRRGARADTSKLGQGIGLSIAVDILSSYNGGLEIEPSQLGGAKFGIRLPKHPTNH